MPDRILAVHSFLSPWLPSLISTTANAVFGKVVEGMDVVRTIGRVPTGAQDRPVEDVVIETVTIV